MPVFYSLFVLWSFPFWLLLLLEFGFLFWAVSCRRGVLALLSLALFCGLGCAPSFQHIYWRISNALQAISDKYWKDKEGHMPTQAQIESVNEQRQQQREEKARKDREEWDRKQAERQRAAGQAAGQSTHQ